MSFQEKQLIDYYNQARSEHKGQPTEFITAKANELKWEDRIQDALTYEDASDNPNID